MALRTHHKAAQRSIRRQSDRARKIAQGRRSSAQFRDRANPMTSKVRAAKSLNFQRREKFDKMFPENCPPDASQSGNLRQLAATYWRSADRADARQPRNYSQ